MAINLDDNYRVILSSDHYSFILQKYLRGISRRTGKLGKGRWIKIAYCGRLVEAIDHYINERIKNKVGEDDILTTPKEILEEYKLIQKELENTFSLPIDQIVPNLISTKIPKTEGEKVNDRRYKQV